MSKSNDFSPTVLVVDDVADTLTTIKAFLEHRRYRVAEATDGQQAVEVALRERPDLILMDLFMPQKDGIAATRSIREHAELRDVPIVAVSAYGTLGILHHEALEAGCNEYVTKPLDFDQLGILVDRLLKRPGVESKDRRQEVSNEELLRRVEEAVLEVNRSLEALAAFSSELKAVKINHELADSLRQDASEHLHSALSLLNRLR